MFYQNDLIVEIITRNALDKTDSDISKADKMILRSLMLVNRCFHEVVSRILLRQTSIRSNYSLSLFCSVMLSNAKYALKIRSLIIGNVVFPVNCIDAILMCRNLTALELYNNAGMSTDDAMRLFTSGTIGKLTKILLVGPELCNDRLVKALTESQSKTLQTLQLLRCENNGVSENSIKYISKCSALRRISIPFDVHGNLDDALAPLCKLENLKHMSLEGLIVHNYTSPYLRTENLFDVLVMMSNLKSLNLSNLDVRRPLSLEPPKVFAKNDTITELELSSIELSNDAVFWILNSFIKLESLDLSYCHNITAEVVRIVIQHSSAFKKLSLVGCSRVEKASVFRIVEQYATKCRNGLNFMIMGSGFIITFDNKSQFDIVEL